MSFDFGGTVALDCVLPVQVTSKGVMSLTFRGQKRGTGLKTKQIKRMESLVEAASISAVDLFREIPSAHLKMLEERSEVRDYRAGHVFFRAGETGQMLFLLEKGHVQTFRTTGGKKLIIGELKPPAVF